MNTYLRRILAVLIGLPELGALLFFLDGRSDDGLLSWVLASVVCTAGLGLVIWIPVCWFLGEVTLEFLGALTGRSSRNRSRAPSAAGAEQAAPAGSALKSALHTYVERMRTAGLADDELRARLRRAGWDEETIAALMRGVDDR